MWVIVNFRFQAAFDWTWAYEQFFFFYTTLQPPSICLQWHCSKERKKNCIAQHTLNQKQDQKSISKIDPIFQLPLASKQHQQLYARLSQNNEKKIIMTNWQNTRSIYYKKKIPYLHYHIIKSDEKFLSLAVYRKQLNLDNKNRLIVSVILRHCLPFCQAKGRYGWKICLPIENSLNLIAFISLKK